MHIGHGVCEIQTNLLRGENRSKLLMSFGVVESLLKSRKLWKNVFLKDFWLVGWGGGAKNTLPFSGAVRGDH